MHDRSSSPRLLAVAHGTDSAHGRAITEQLATAIAASRPGTPVELCYLDVISPRLPDVLDERPTVVVPLLLSTGYHVQTDIPAAVRPHTGTVVARHLGPDPLLVDVLVDRLPPLTAPTVLVGAGSSRAEARRELDETAALLSARVDAPVDVRTMADDLAAEFGRRPRPLRVATYLLAEGRFSAALGAAARVAGQDVAVAGPLGVHPALVRLVWARFDQAVAGNAAAWVR